MSLASEPLELDIINVSLSTTEAEWEVPANTKHWTMQARGSSVVHVAISSGVVGGTPSGTYGTIKASQALTSADKGSFSGQTLYFGVESGTETLEIIRSKKPGT